MRKLWRKLFEPRRPPSLVLPIPEIGPTAEDLKKVCRSDWEKLRKENLQALVPDDAFLWPPDDRRLGLRLKPPPHSEWQQRYNEVKGGHITYNANVARTRLLEMIQGEQGPRRFIIAPASTHQGFVVGQSKGTNVTK